MDENLNDNASLMVRIQQLEQERDELRKDIEQLCLQQAGPSYLLVATKMHFQRTAGLEQEIENLKKKLSACSRESLNLQEELSEAYRIKSQLADLHNAEVVKNKEAEKQVKFFQGCVAAAFAERDNAIMEAEKAKEKEEFMSRKFNDLQRRIEELSADCIEQKKYTEKLQVDLTMEEEQNETFKKVINKFYEIKRHSLEVYGDVSWDDKCAILLDDPMETWSYNDASTAKYISALEEELQTLRNSIDKLQNKLLGLEIENHLKRRVLELEKKRILADEMIRKEIAGLRNYHSRHKVDIMNLLGDGMTHIKSIIGCIDEKIRQFDISRAQDLGSTPKEVNQDEYECRDVHINTDVGHDLLSERNSAGLSDIMAHVKADASDALAQALQEKVATLLLLSQQEERYLLDRNVNAALQKKIEELQRNLLQVTNEKVRALMELAHLKQEYRLLKEKLGGCVDKESLSAEIGDKKPDTQERDGRLRNLLKKANLKRWVGTLDFRGNEAEVHMDGEGNFSSKRFNSIDFARMKIENASLKESMESMEHLITSIHRLRLSLLKAKESVTSQSTGIVMSESLDEIINEAKLVKTALGSSLPISWSAEAEIGFDGENISNESGDSYGNASSEKIDSVSAAGFEMVELLILAAHILKEYPMKSNT
ncbi:uncharacterized protein LOC107426931 isoform X2 [Ziziphus jujuba]|uniref:Uncharacterized protein LOC107426931 isoform X2 n=1 Tax=Ziziphus jujuba TaxID=326968 RepID=A0ABM3IVR5_ZIZJJ|nr:uncharacterized protein LOC107426931 isoform X2 [Ziziphus jujuba]